MRPSNIYYARNCITTTPYNRNFFKTLAKVGGEKNFIVYFTKNVLFVLEH